MTFNYKKKTFIHKKRSFKEDASLAYLALFNVSSIKRSFLSQRDRDERFIFLHSSYVLGSFDSNQWILVLFFLLSLFGSNCFGQMKRINWRRGRYSMGMTGVVVIDNRLITSLLLRWWRKVGHSVLLQQWSMSWQFSQTARLLLTPSPPSKMCLTSIQLVKSLLFEKCYGPTDRPTQRYIESRVRPVRPVSPRKFVNQRFDLFVGVPSTHSLLT